MQSNQEPLYLVIRYGFTAKVDAVQEIEKVMAKRGKAWFGKYGQPIGRNLQQLVDAKKREVFVVLTRRGINADASGYFSQTFKLRQLTRTAPKHKAEFPSYYCEHLKNISSWLELEPYHGPRIDLKYLITVSSLIPLLHSFRASQRGHFLCKLWPRH